VLDVPFESYQLEGHPSRATNVVDNDEFIYRNLPTKHHVLRKVPDCIHCGALRFPYEGPAFCCRKGKVSIVTPEVPEELKRLFTSQEDVDAKYFRENIRYFNSHFSFTSLGVTLDRRVSTAARTGVYTFRITAGLYHALDNLVAADNGPRHFQLYIYDTDENLIHRANRSPDLNIEHVDDLNDKMISRFPGEERLYHSFDSIDDDLQNNYTIDFLNSITPNGLPPHVLKLKVNCPVILLRNLDPHNGLCNGTRLMIRAFQDNAIDAEIVGGQHAGKRVFIPRIPMSPSDDISLPFKLKRKQFPIRLSFAMTINKAQGQTIPHVGIYLPEPVFSHGQLYVALSRGVSRKTTRILAKPNNEVDKSGKSTKNIVYRDVLQG
jgi:hypothetical protein